MSKARNIATLLDSGGDVLASALDNALGGPSLGTASIVRTNSKIIDENLTFNNQNGSSVGPITVAANRVITVDSGSTWVIL